MVKNHILKRKFRDYQEKLLQDLQDQELAQEYLLAVQPAKK